MMRMGLWWESSLIVWWDCWLFYHLEDRLLVGYRIFMLRSLHMTLESCHDYRGWSWGLVCDEQLWLMRSSSIFLWDDHLWDDHLWDYYGAFGVGFGAQFQMVNMVISDGHRSSISIIWGFESMMFETVVTGWVTFILVSSHPYYLYWHLNHC